MLTFDGVEFNYPNQNVFSDLNFSVDNGEFTFLIGRSGAGKTTVMQLIYMNILPQNGAVYVGDYDSKTIKLKDLPFLRRKLGVVFQDFKLLNDRNIYDNLAFVLEVTNASRKEIKRKVNNVLTDVGLIHRRKSLPAELSGGEKQRIAIARAIINDPFLILADEPTGNLDPQTADEILDILKNINSKGTAILFATHNYGIVKKMNSKIIKLENGKAVKAVLKSRK